MSRPRVIVYSEVSADGKTTHRSGASSKDMMALEDDAVRVYRHELRARCDAIMVGANTIRLDDPLLTVRHAEGQSPLRVIPASRGELPANARVLTDGERTLIVISRAAAPETVERLLATGASVITAGDERVDLARMLEALSTLGVRSVMVEGGATLLASLFRARLVDRLIVQHLPAIFGGAGVPAMVGGEPLESVDQAIPLRLVEVRHVGGHAVIVYDA
jgi:riboflavin-specific deaminase-like protein